MLRVNIRLHFPTVEWFVLFKVNNVESYFFPTYIFNCEIKPLDVTSRICIDSHKKIILVLSHLDGGIQIAAFELTIKNELIASFDGGVHALEESSWTFRFKIGVEFTKISGHVREAAWNNGLVLESIFVFDLLLDFEAAGVASA